MPEQPENLVLQLLRELPADIARNADRLATKDDIARLDQNIDRVDQKIDILRADVASDLANLEKRLGDQEKRLTDQIAHLRRAVMEYHSSTIGHGVPMSEFEERLRRVEQRLGIEQ